MFITKTHMLEELFAVIYGEDRPDFRSLRLTRVEWQEEDLTLWLDVFYHDEDDIIDEDDTYNPDPVQHWRITCSSIREQRFSLGHHYHIDLFDDHVLLMPHVTRRAVLSFHGRVDDVSPVVGALYERHKEVVGNWIPFGKYLNGMRLTSLLNGGFGMFAEGPEALMVAYKEVLERYGISASYHDSESFAFSNDDTWIEETARLKVLLLEESFIVAADFKAQRV